MFGHHHLEVQGGVGELQGRQSRCHYYCHYSCPCDGSIPLSNVDLLVIGAGFTEGIGEADHQQLEDEVEDAAKKLAGDIDLFGETEGNGEAQ